MGRLPGQSVQVRSRGARKREAPKAVDFSEPSLIAFPTPALLTPMVLVPIETCLWM